MSTIAIVDDEDDLREVVAEFLRDRGLDVVEAESAQALRALMTARKVDLAVLDVTMPGESGFQLAQWLRGRSRRIGIIFATASDASRDRIAGLEAGADDYVVKPYDLHELYSRIRSVLRRLPAEAPVQFGATEAKPSAVVPAGGTKLVKIGPLLFDPATGRLGGPALGDGRAVSLTAAESDLLCAFASRPGRLLSRGQLLDLARARSDDSGSRSIDVRVARLRKKIETMERAPATIHTVRGEGYMLVPAAE